MKNLTNDFHVLDDCFNLFSKLRKHPEPCQKDPYFHAFCLVVALLSTIIWSGWISDHPDHIIVNNLIRYSQKTQHLWWPILRLGCSTHNKRFGFNTTSPINILLGYPLAFQFLLIVKHFSMRRSKRGFEDIL